MYATRRGDMLFSSSTVDNESAWIESQDFIIKFLFLKHFHEKQICVRMEI